MAKIIKTRKMMTFPQQLIELVEKKARRLGFDFNDYVRLVLANDIQKDIDASLPVEIATPEMEKEIGEALKDYSEGKYKEFNSVEELMTDLED